jgi:hypothetical protein
MTRLPTKTKGPVRTRASAGPSLAPAGSHSGQKGTTYVRLGDTHEAALKLLRFPRT